MVRFVHDERGFPLSLHADGHVDLAEHGKDLVCAASSAILQAAWVGLTEVAGVDVTGERRSGCLELHWPTDMREEPALRVIVATAEAALRHLALQYPENLSLRRETYGVSDP